MLTYEEGKNIIDAIVKVLNNKHSDIFDILPSRKIDALMSDITDEELILRDYGASLVADGKLVIFVNFGKIYKVLKESNTEFPEDVVEDTIRAQLVQTFLHEFCHFIIQTNHDLWKSDQEYQDYIEARVNSLASAMIHSIAIELNELTNIPIMHLIGRA